MTSTDLDVLGVVRSHLSEGRAALAEMFGGHLEESSHASRLRTRDGREFLNCAGYGVFLLGATHPHVTEAVVAQVRRHPLSTRVVLDPVAAEAARTLVEVCPPGLSQVHFTGSGAEATETAIKLARAHGKRRLVTTVDGYHGKTMGALSLTARDLYQKPFQPLLPDVVQIPYGDAEALAGVLADGVPSCFVVEPVQGEAGVIVPPSGYLAEVAEVCRRHGCFLVVDEILTGLGRLGRWWGVDADGIIPDVMLVGKALSGGVIPVAAAVATRAALRPFSKDPFLHTSTFSAAPVAMAAARAAVEAIQAEDAVGTAGRLGSLLVERLRHSATRCPHLVREVRGVGLLIGVEMRDSGLAGELLMELFDAGILVNHSLNNSAVLRLTPPVTLTASEVDRLLAAFDTAFDTLAARFPG
ncbi:aminotransferase class III-fold pyridoxal phosphate-dependent enzyme [Plantactinospora sp. B6F1]|uniref:aspartate aminotransferase family protein n=1 Tax=Plantactinospora sp. B6F1 TaxID=3158971 RepID=UPI0032D8EB86